MAIPPEWGIPTTFNICDLTPYRGPLEVPAEPGLPPDSTESSLLVPEENDGPRPSAATMATDDDPYDIPRTWEATEVTNDDEAASAETVEDDATPDEGEGRPRRSAKPTPRLTDHVYY